MMTYQWGHRYVADAKRITAAQEAEYHRQACIDADRLADEIDEQFFGLNIAANC
jgi:hypothetical protein